MDQNDIALIRQLNRVQLARNVANANAQFSPAMIAVTGVLAGAGACALLLWFFRSVGA